jgi:hypothetical protein
MQFTMDQINQLASMGFPMNGVAEGDEATAEEMAALKIQPDVGPDVSDDLSAPVAAPQMTPDAVSAAVQATPAAPAVTQEQLSATPAQGGSSFMDAIFGPKEENDQYSNLNRQQRMMLAFGAIKDAGFALQGKESNAFNSTLKAINAQMDMGRKARAAAAQRDALTSIMGPGGAASGDIQAQIEQLSRLAVAQPSLAPGIAVRIKALQDQLQAQMGEVETVTTAEGQLDLIGQMKDKVNYLTTGPIGMVAAMLPWSDAFALRNMAVTLESNLAFSTLVQLKSQGGTLGAVSEKELDLLKAEISKFNADMKPEDVIKQLERVDAEYRRIIRRAFETSSDVGKLTDALGGRPAWLDAPAAAGTRSDADLDATYGG